MTSDNIRTKIFGNPSTAEKRRTHTNHVILGGEDLNGIELPHRISISPEEDLFFIPPEHDLIPDEIHTNFGRKRLDGDHRKFWRRADIVSLARVTDPRSDFRNQMKWIIPHNYIRAYSWKPADGPRVYVALTALIDGRRLYFTVTKTFPQLGIRDQIEVRSYGPDTVARFPSRSMEEVKRYTVGFSNLPTRESGEPWYNLLSDHSCEDKEYRGLRMKGYFADDHVVAAFTAVEFQRSGTPDPINHSPFLIPSRTLATFDRKLRDQVIKLYYPKDSNEPKERNLLEAERELLLWMFLGLTYLYEEQRSYDKLFVDTYDGVDEYMTIPV